MSAQAGSSRLAAKRTVSVAKTDVELRALIVQSFEQAETPMVARACGSIYASWVIAVARTGLPGSCGRAACAPGRSVVSGLAPPTAAIVTRSRKTGWQKVPAPDRPGQLWQSDITYIETEQGWLYLAFISMPVRGAASHTIAGKTCSLS